MIFNRKKVYCKDCIFVGYTDIGKYIRSFSHCKYKRKIKKIEDPYKLYYRKVYLINPFKQNKNNHCKYYQEKCI